MSTSRTPLFSLNTWKPLAKGRIPGQVVIQYTDRCNAACVQCGMRRTSDFPRTTMNPEQLKPQIDAMAAQGVQAISFTGGEPLLCREQVVELAKYAGAAGIRYIRTGTNGYIFMGSDKPDFTDKIARIADQLADSPINTFWISVDSADPATHEKNRGFAGIVNGMEKALPIFHERGLYPSANLGINRLTGGPKLAPASSEPRVVYNAFRTSFARFYRFVESLGFTIVNACYPMSHAPEDAEAVGDSAVYAATSSDDFIHFSPAEKREVFQALYDTVPEFRSRLRIFTPRCSLLALIRSLSGDGEKAYACRGGIDFFFMDSRDMNTYPCGYRGAESLGKFTDLDVASLGQAPFCKECDWECFRDPSELIGPFTELLQRPLSVAGRLLQDKEYRSVWLKDLRYYKACGYFDGRSAPDMAALARFGCSS